MNAKRIATLALLAAMALAVQYLESLLPPIVPGVPFKLGLANIFTLIALLRFSRRDALLICAVRAPLGALLTATPIGIVYALVGSLLAWAGMAALLGSYQRGRLSPIGLSAAGAFLFNVGQLLVGLVIMGNAVIAYFPIMCGLSIPAGALTGLICLWINSRVIPQQRATRSSPDCCCNPQDK